MPSEAQNCKYKVNILRVKWNQQCRYFFVAIIAPVFAQLIQTCDWDQNSGVWLVFGLSENTEQKTNPKSEVAQWLDLQTSKHTTTTAEYQMEVWKEIYRKSDK